MLAINFHQNINLDQKLTSLKEPSEFCVNPCRIAHPVLTHKRTNLLQHPRLPLLPLEQNLAEGKCISDSISKSIIMETPEEPHYMDIFTYQVVLDHATVENTFF